MPVLACRRTARGPHRCSRGTLNTGTGTRHDAVTVTPGAGDRGNVGRDRLGCHRGRAGHVRAAVPAPG